MSSPRGDAIHVDVDAGINTAIRKIRQALEDNSLQPRYLETVMGKGYRFIGPITVIDKASPLTEPAGLPGSKMRSWLVLSAAVLMMALVIYLWTSLGRCESAKHIKKKRRSRESAN